MSAVKAKGEKIAALLLVVMSAVCLGFVTLSALNVSLAKEPEIHTCKIVDKHSGSGRYRTPCVDVSFRGKEVSVKVGVDFYTEAQIGDSVSVEYYEGGIGFDYLCIP